MGRTVERQEEREVLEIRGPGALWYNKIVIIIYFIKL
jgi:hypothetical protein